MSKARITWVVKSFEAKQNSFWCLHTLEIEDPTALKPHQYFSRQLEFLFQLQLMVLAFPIPQMQLMARLTADHAIKHLSVENNLILCSLQH